VRRKIGYGQENEENYANGGVKSGGYDRSDVYSFQFGSKWHSESPLTLMHKRQN